MSTKKYYFTFFPEVYIRDFKQTIFLFNTINNSKFRINDVNVINCIRNGIENYNNSILFFESNAEFFRILKIKGFGDIEILDSLKYSPFRSKIKILNDRDIIIRKNELIIRQQLCNNLMEINFFLFDLFLSSNIIERQYILKESKQRESSHHDWELFKLLSNQVNEFKNYQKFNVFIDSGSYLNDFLKLNIDWLDSSLWLHLPFDLYDSNAHFLANFPNIVVWIYNLNDLFKLNLLNKNQKIIFKAFSKFMIEEVQKNTDLEDNISIEPLFENNISFFEDNVFTEELDLLEMNHKLEYIVRNRIINYNDFGRLFVDLSGNYGTNQYCNSLGVMNTNNLSEVLMKCIDSKNSTWLKTREKIVPCKECQYCELCPPITGIEYLIGRYNLCHIFHE